MSDIKTAALPDAGATLGTFDWLVDGASLASDDDVQTAVILSLFTDRRAKDDDELPDARSDRRGWWGDAYADVDGDQIGSRLWLLARQKRVASTLQRAQQYASEALQWLIDDGVASTVGVQARGLPGDVLDLQIVIERPSGTLRFAFAQALTVVSTRAALAVAAAPAPSPAPAPAPGPAPAPAGLAVFGVASQGDGTAAFILT